MVLVDPRGWVLLQERDEHPVIDPGRGGWSAGTSTPARTSSRRPTGSWPRRPASVSRPGRWSCGRSSRSTTAGLRDLRRDAGLHRADDGRPMPTSSSGRGGRSSSSTPPRSAGLPLTASASRILPEFLGSDGYRNSWASVDVLPPGSTDAYRLARYGPPRVDHVAARPARPRTTPSSTRWPPRSGTSWSRRAPRTGGHLGPNLGVVELTLAIHRVFDSPRDRVVFDTGHQAYVHKILTGRAARVRHAAPARAG